MNTTGENKIDVLAVLDFNIDADEIAGANPECVAELREARAAVAELVEATRAFRDDNKRNQWHPMYRDMLANLEAALAPFQPGA